VIAAVLFLKGAIQPLELKSARIAPIWMQFQMLKSKVKHSLSRKTNNQSLIFTKQQLGNGLENMFYFTIQTKTELLSVPRLADI